MLLVDDIYKSVQIALSSSHYKMEMETLKFKKFNHFFNE